MINPIKKYKEKKELEKLEQERLKREEEERKAREEDERKALEDKKKKISIISIVIGVVVIILVAIVGFASNLNSHSDEIKVPTSLEECVNSTYTDVEYMFKNAGFTNVITEPMGDLITGWINNENSVDHITIDGQDREFFSNTYLKPDARIVIYYHSFPVIETTTKKEIQTTETITEQTTVTTTETTTVTTTKAKEETTTKKKIDTTTKKNESNINSNKSEAHEYVLNTKSNIFHKPSCTRGPKPDSKNIAYVNATKEELISQGYKPCKVCNP